jgi:hypothetical protein
VKHSFSFCAVKLLTFGSFFILFVACDKLSDVIEDRLYHGTNIGYKRCVDKNRTEGLSEHALESLCKEHHESARNVPIDGKAGYYFYRDKNPFDVFDELTENQVSGAKGNPQRPKTAEEYLKKFEKIDKAKVVWCEFNGDFTNKSKEFIITSFEVAIKHQDNRDPQDTPIEEKHKIRDLWIEPGMFQHFSITILKYIPKENRTDKGLFTWAISDIRGLKVKLK